MSILTQREYYQRQHGSTHRAAGIVLNAESPFDDGAGEAGVMGHEGENRLLSNLGNGGRWNHGHHHERS